MLRIRRLYFYAVLYASLGMLLTGAATLLRVLLERLLDVPSSGLLGNFVGREQIQEQTAVGIALVVVGLPVWAIHWRVVQGWLKQPQAFSDRTSALRRLYVYAVLLTTGIVTYASSRDLLENLLALLVGQAGGPFRLAAITGTLPFALTASALWAYHWQVATADRSAAGEDGTSATLRRWYLYPVLVFSAVVLMWNMAWLAQRAWEFFVSANDGSISFGQLTLARAVASNGASLLVAASIWFGHQVWSQRQVAGLDWHGDNERQSVLRQVHLYALVLVTVVWALANASEILRFALASVLGVAPSSIDGNPVLFALGGPLANALVFGGFWAFYWRAVNREAAVQLEVGRRAAVRRLYFYLVSAIALGFTAWSLASLLRLGADLLLQASVVDASGRRAELARDVSWLLIGLFVWVMHWSRTQALASGERGLEETRATTRRWYLYLVAFAAVAALLFSAGRVVYDVVLVGLGRAADATLLADVSHALVDAIVAATVLGYHWFLVLRADLAALRHVADTKVAVVVISGLDAAAVVSLERFAHTMLHGARTRVYWTDQAHQSVSLAQALEDGDTS